MVYGRRGIFTFVALTLLVGNLAENTSIRTGFPFRELLLHGRDGTGALPRARLIGFGVCRDGISRLDSWLPHFGRDQPYAFRIEPIHRAHLFGLHHGRLDLSMDPVWSTVVHAWILGEGGTDFCVPVTNFLGWYMTVYTI